MCNNNSTATDGLLIRLKHIAFIFLALNVGACSQLTHDTLDAGNKTVEHVVLISIDGLRPDAINENNAPNLFKLTQSGLYYPNAQTIQRSVTLPSHTSMLTGLDSKRHKIDQNESLPGFISYPTVMKLVRQNGKTTAALFSKEKLYFLLPPDSVDYVYGRGQNGVDYHQTNASSIASEFSRIWDKNGFNLTFIHIREPDSSGHKFGWMSSHYLDQAVTATDQAIGQIYYSIINSPYAKSTLLIITADHGGMDKIHWSNRPEDLTIPWLAIHPAIPPAMHTNEQVSIYDTTPTILYLLGLSIPIGLDGQVIPGIQSLFPDRSELPSH